MSDDQDDFDDDNHNDDAVITGHVGDRHEGSEIIGFCDSVSTKAACELLLGRVYEERLKAQMEISQKIYNQMLLEAQRKNKIRRFIPFLDLIYPPSVIEIHNELHANQNDSLNPFYEIANRFKNIETLAQNTILSCGMHPNVPVPLGLLRSLNKFGVENPKPVTQRRIGF